MFRVALFIVVLLAAPQLAVLFLLFLLLRWLFRAFQDATQSIITALSRFWWIFGILILGYILESDNIDHDGAGILILIALVAALVYVVRRRAGIRASFKARGTVYSGSDTRHVDGRDYEEYVAQKIKKEGWAVTLTPHVGDHGADIIAEKNGIALAIQCKMLTAGNVGNNAIQEVFTAMHIYNCTHSCVVTNSSYTASAHLAAERTNVYLLHHDQLPSYLAQLLR